MARNGFQGEGEEHRHYHVVGIRTDGSTVIMGTGLAMDEAKRVRAALVEAEIFPVLQIVRGDVKAMGSSGGS